LAADGTALPLADDSFDRIHHADVLCCMDHKQDMLRECWRVARNAAHMEFSVISLVRQPAKDGERRVLEQSGPPYPDAGGEYAALLADTGWSVLERIDVTAEFVRCMITRPDGPTEHPAYQAGLAGFVKRLDPLPQAPRSAISSSGRRPG